MAKWQHLILGAALLTAGRALWRARNWSSFEGKNVLITGGSRGLGLVMARQLLKQGSTVAVCARDREELQQAFRNLEKIGPVRAIACDITDRFQVMDLVDRLTADWGRIDILINNAGIIQSGPMAEMNLRDYEESIQTHFYGALYAIEAVLPQMRQRRAGRIVNIASIGGLISVPHLLPYCVSKFALVGYSLGLRSELTKDGILVTTICPGLVRTGSPRNAFFKSQHRREYALFKLADSLPLLSMNAERAAHQILEACRYGRSFSVLGGPMKVAATLNALSPGTGATLLGMANRLLPGPGGIDESRGRGYQSKSMLSETPLTGLTDAAAARNNEIS